MTFKCAEGVFVLPHNLLVDFECLANTFPAVVDRIPIEITFPIISGDPLSSNLRFNQPTFVNEEFLNKFVSKFDTTHQFWGSPDTYRIFAEGPYLGTGTVQAVKVSVSGDFVNSATLENLSKSFKNFWRDFESWASVISTQVLQIGYSTVSEFHDLCIWDVDSQSIEQAIGFGAHLEINLHQQSPISANEVELAFNLASRSLLPTDAFIILQNAAALKLEGNYRLATIEAGTSAELSLTQLVAKHGISNKHEHLEEISRSFTTLGSLASHAQKLGILVPPNFWVDLVHIRNKAIHDGETILSSEAEVAIELAREMAISAWPTMFASE